MQFGADPYLLTDPPVPMADWGNVNWWEPLPDSGGNIELPESMALQPPSQTVVVMVTPEHVLVQTGPAGLGVQVAGISTNFAQGSAQATGRATDMMISRTCKSV